MDDLKRAEDLLQNTKGNCNCFGILSESQVSVVFCFLIELNFSRSGEN